LLHNLSRNMSYSVKNGDTLNQLANQYKTTMDAIVNANHNIDFHNVSSGEILLIPHESSNSQNNYAAETIIINTLRTLWEQHVAWTRMTIISAAAGMPDLNMVVTRLLRNATDMADALKPFYGESDAKKFENLIKDHLTIALQLVTAAKKGDNKNAQDAERRWHSNADDIADFLSSINPYISKDDFKKMLYQHLELTKAEAVARLNNEYTKDIDLYDQIEKQALQMADIMSYAIIQQFPNEI
jgi:hypothetical protein